MTSFRADLYRGTARYYDLYRPSYPEALVHNLVQRLALSGQGRLLDLACGTGQVAFPLATHFLEVVAVDQESEFVDFGKAKAESAGVANICWLAGAAETVTLEGQFELITVGNAFHRLNRPVVAQRMKSLLQSGGGAALLWGDGPWPGSRPWQNAVAELVAEWAAKVGAGDRVPAGWKQAMEAEPNEQVLRRAGLEYAGRFEFGAQQSWTIDTLIGFMYSTSLLSREALGASVAAFERDVANRLAGFSADGIVQQSASYAYELAVRTS